MENKSLVLCAWKPLANIYSCILLFIFLFIFCNRDKNLTQHHMQGKGKKKNKKKKRNEKNDRCFVQRINKIRANPFAYFM